MFSEAQHISASGSQFNAVGNDRNQGVVMHINYYEGRDEAPPQAVVPPIVPQNPADALRVPGTNVDPSPYLPATYRIAVAKQEI